MEPKRHTFVAYAFRGSFNIPEIASQFASSRAKTDPHDTLFRSIRDNSGIFIYRFGVVAFWNYPVEERNQELSEFVSRQKVELAQRPLQEEFLVIEDPSREPAIEFNFMTLNQMTPERAEVIALTIAQSAAMEHYEGLMDLIWTKVNLLMDNMRVTGYVPIRPRSFHRMIGETVMMRNEIVGVLHLLDKPDLIWTDPVMDGIYGDLRSTFDLQERFQALEYKLETTQGTLELTLDAARDRRSFITELSILILIFFEIILSLTNYLR